MTRSLRVEYEGAFYHVMNRGRGRQTIFHDKSYFDAFLDCLKQAHGRFALEVHAYCLMGNHYHLLVRTPRANLSRAMRHINGVYTQFYNRHRKTEGTLFRGRYKAINVEASSYLLEVSRYIHRNPVETRRPLVDELEQYSWSSYPSYRNKVESPPWLTKEAIFAELASGQPTAAYRRFVEQGIDAETQKFYTKNHWPAVRGQKAFVESAYLRALSVGKDVNDDKPLISFEEVISTVTSRYSCDRAQILVGRRGGGGKRIERWLAMKLCRELTGETLIKLADRFGLGSYSSVSTIIRRLDRMMAEDVGLTQTYNSLRQDISP